MKLNLTLINDLKELPKMLEVIEEFCQQIRVPDHKIFQLNLVLDELVTNIISYGYDAPPKRHKINITLSCQESILQAIVTDDGKLFNPLESPPPNLNLSLEDKPIGGLGIHLARTLMDKVDYQRVNCTNQLTLIVDINKLETEA